MDTNIGELGQKEARFLSALAERGDTIFTTQEAQEFWGAPAHTYSVLRRLQEKGWVQRLERGIYMLLPLAAGPERRWAEDSFVIAGHLVRNSPAAVAYWSALHYWNMTEQIPQVVFVQSTARRHKRQVRIQGIAYRFVVVKERRFFGVITQYREGQPFPVTDREKTLIDACDRLDLSGGIAQTYQALQAGLHQIEWERLDEYLARMGSGAIYKRLGYLIDRGGLAIPAREERLDRWQTQLKSGVSPLEPGAGAAGRIDSRWQLRLNVDTAGLIGGLDL